MMNLKMGSSSFNNQQNNHGIMVVDHQLNNLHQSSSTISSPSSSKVYNAVSSESDTSTLEEEEEEEKEEDEVNSSSEASSPSGQPLIEPLNDMSSLFLQLPIKRGLSKHFQGKSQSFTSLSKVRCLEDLAKPENPYNSKRLKYSKSYGGLLLENHKSSISSNCSRLISKKAQRGSCSSLNAKRNNSCFLGNNIV